MNKIYSLILLLLISFQGISQSISITKIIETDCGSPYVKSVELYVSGTIDFANDPASVHYMNNGKAWNETEFDLTPLGSVTDSHIYIVRDIATMQAEFPSVTFDSSNTITDGNATNGDDGYRAVINGNVVSQFGKDQTDADDDPAADWNHNDTVFSRTIGVVDDGTWNSSQWTGESENSLDGLGVCKAGDGFEAAFASLGNGHPLQSWTPPTASIDDVAINKLSIYPNPLNSNNRILHINSNFKEDINIKIYDISGKEILNKQLATNTIDLSNLKTGVYIVGVKHKDINFSSRLILK